MFPATNSLPDLAQTIEAEQAALKELYLDSGQARSGFNRQTGQKNREDEQLKAQENEIREIKKKLDDLRNQINEIEIQCREVVLHGENLKTAVAEKHNVVLEDLLPEFTGLKKRK